STICDGVHKMRGFDSRSRLPDRGQRDGFDDSAQPCSLWHFAMKLVFAAPLSGLPFDPIALGSHISRLHLARKAVRAAPSSSRPSFPIACSRTYLALV